MNTTINMESQQIVNALIAPRKDEFVLPEGIVADGADLVPTVQYLMQSRVGSASSCRRMGLKRRAPRSPHPTLTCTSFANCHEDRS